MRTTKVIEILEKFQKLTNTCLELLMSILKNWRIDFTSFDKKSNANWQFILTSLNFLLPAVLET